MAIGIHQLSCLLWFSVSRSSITSQPGVAWPVDVLVSSHSSGEVK